MLAAGYSSDLQRHRMRYPDILSEGPTAADAEIDAAGFDQRFNAGPDEA